MPNDAACFVAFWQTVSNVWQSVRSVFAIGSQPISWVYVGILRNVLQSISWCLPRICGMFATCSFSVCYIFALQKYGFCGAKVWFLTCKKGVFELQKYGFCFLNVALLQIVRHAFAPHKQRCCNLFASKKPKLSMCIEEFRPPKIV